MLLLGWENRLQSILNYKHIETEEELKKRIDDFGKWIEEKGKAQQNQKIYLKQKIIYFYNSLSLYLSLNFITIF